jgi:hypothetical protein
MPVAQQAAALAPGGAERRVEGKRLFVGGERLVVAFEKLQRLAALEVRLRMMRLATQHVVEVLERGRVSAECHQGLAVAQPVGDAARVDREHALVAGQRLRMAAERRMGDAAMRLRIDVGRLDRERLVEDVERGFPAAEPGACGAEIGEGRRATRHARQRRGEGGLGGLEAAGLEVADAFEEQRLGALELFAHVASDSEDDGRRDGVALRGWRVSRIGGIGRGFSASWHGRVNAALVAGAPSLRLNAASSASPACSPAPSSRR